MKQMDTSSVPSILQMSLASEKNELMCMDTLQIDMELELNIHGRRDLTEINRQEKNLEEVTKQKNAARQHLQRAQLERRVKCRSY